MLVKDLRRLLDTEEEILHHEFSFISHIPLKV